MSKEQKLLWRSTGGPVPYPLTGLDEKPTPGRILRVGVVLPSSSAFPGPPAPCSVLCASGAQVSGHCYLGKKRSKLGNF